MIPPRIKLGQKWNIQLSSVLHNYRDYGHTPNTIMGYKIPDFQRPLVWTLEQKIKLIESLYLGYDIGTFTINENADIPEIDNILIDGMQRLFAIQEYITDKFEVFGSLYSELDFKYPDKRYRARFSSSSIGQYVLDSDDIQFLKQHYNRLNFSGTAHKEEDRAWLIGF